MPTKPLAPLQREERAMGFALGAFGVLGIAIVTVEHPYWWAPVVGAGLALLIAAFWSFAVLRPVRRILDEAPRLPVGAEVEADAVFRRRMAVRIAVFVAVVIALAALNLDAGAFVSPIGFTGLGISLLLNARWIARREEQLGVRFVRERKVWRRKTPVIFSQAATAADG